MALEYRTPTEEEFEPALLAAEAAFGEEIRPDEIERVRRTLGDLDRVIVAFDGGRPVGLTLSFRFELTVPGGAVPAAGVTWVSVQPSHRRRGILRELMRRQLEDAGARGEPVAILWASEAAIYGRFGYGMAAPAAELDGERHGFAFRDGAEAVGAVRLVSVEEAAELFPPILDRVRRERPGMLARSRDWWDVHRLPDPEHWRHGASPKFYVLYEVDGRPEGYAMYRVKADWARGLPQSEARVIEAIATSPVATRELWRFLFGLDLIARVKSFPFDPASPLFLQVVDPRRLHLALNDGLWLRLTDLEGALAARTYAGDDSVVLDVLDGLLPGRGGRVRVGAAGVERTGDEPDVRISVADLASAYLGAFDFERLAAAARVEELRPGGVERAGRLFRTPLPPYAAEMF
jgi:predicted acetyltransferase